MIAPNPESIPYVRPRPAMTRHACWFACLLLPLVMPECRAAEPSPTMLRDYLLGQAALQFEARRLDVASRTTPEEIRQRQETLRARFRAALGDFPERTSLNPRLTGNAERDGFRIEKVVYEARPKHHVTAVLYLPEGKGPFPGVLVPCGHSANGKAAEAYQRICICLARNGLAALCFDPIGQGERVQWLDDKGKGRLGSTDEHTSAGLGALLVGRSTALYSVWDGIRSLDYLASRPEIDPERLGATGNSGGGTMTAYLMALDDRIKAAAPACYITSLERLFATIGPQDAEQNITGQVAFGMDHADYVTMRAPKPTLMCVGTQDYFDIGGSWASFREAKLLYGRLGFGERVELFESDEPHGFTKPRREAAMRWLRRWLMDKNDAATEPDGPVFTDAELQGTRSGQVVRDEPGEKTVFDLNADRAEQLARQRASAPRDDAWRDAVRRLIALPSPRVAAVEKSRGDLMGGAGLFTAQQVEYETEPGITVSGVGGDPVKNAPRSPLTVIIGASVNSDAFNPGKPTVIFAPEPMPPPIPLVTPDPIPSATPASSPKEDVRGSTIKLMQTYHNGAGVFIAELRGFGKSEPDRAGRFGADEKEAWMALHLGRPLLGQRVGDLLSLLDALGEQGKYGFHVVGVSQAAPIALHAAALDPRIVKVTLVEPLGSWDDLARHPVARFPLANIVPGALAVYDLPDLAAALAPRPLAIHAASGPDGQPLTRERLETIYAPARAAYRRLNAAGSLTIEIEK